MTTAHDLDVTEIHGKLDRLRREIGKILVGNESLIEQCIIALLCEGHVLIEGAPGLGKTKLVKTIGEAVGLKTSRIQFTPDLMPADVVGTNVLIGDETASERVIQFSPGPIFANLVLADEINRATPKTQSALLEAMQEKTVTVSGQTYPIERPFFVMATQNPIEMEGTYPLPEAQIDRFLFKLIVNAPSPSELMRIIERTTGAAEPPVHAVLDGTELLKIQDLVREVPIASHITQMVVDLIHATHPTAESAPEVIRRYVTYGSSPRGAQSIVLAAKARALMHGRFNVAVEDVVAMALPALRHRLILNFEAEAEGVLSDRLIDDVIQRVATRRVAS